MMASLQLESCIIKVASGKKTFERETLQVAEQYNVIQVQVLLSETRPDLLCPRRGAELRQVSQGEAGDLLGLQAQDRGGPHQLQQEVLSPRLHEG